MPSSRAARHAFLYDVVRWQRFRIPLLLLGGLCIVGGDVIAPALHRGSAGIWLTYVGAGALGFLVNFWLRTRYSHLSVEDERLVVKKVGATIRIPLTDVRRARVAKVSAVAGRADRRKQLPRPAERWLDQEAVILRLDIEATDLVKLRRLLGKQFVFESDLVAPVVEPEGLLQEIEEGMPRPEPSPGGPRRRRRR